MKSITGSQQEFLRFQKLSRRMAQTPLEIPNKQYIEVYVAGIPALPVPPVAICS